MKIILPFFIVVISVVIGHAEWKAAAAKTIITPQEPMYLARFANREVPAEGGYEAFRSLMYWSNLLHPDKFADTLEERIIAKVHDMWK